MPLIMQWGKEARVSEPPELIQRVKEAAQGIAKLYAKKCHPPVRSLSRIFSAQATMTLLAGKKD
jgi:hypothetical protein